MTTTKWKNGIPRIIGIALGSFLYACGISLFLDPNNIAPGGMAGIAIILNRLLHLETGTLYFLLNIPIILLGLWKFGVAFIASTFWAIAVNSLFTNLLSDVGAVTSEPLLSALAGSILVGAGVGIVFRCGATTGGTDIIVKILRSKYKHIKTGFLFLMMDVVIVSISGIVFKDFNVVMYALIAVTVTNKVMDYVLYGGDEAKLIYIISNQSDKIAERILSELDIGITFLHGQGGFSKADKRVILCVARNNVGPQVEEIVKQEDKNAFMIISSANEIYGEGYKNILNEKI